MKLFFSCLFLFVSLLSTAQRVDTFDLQDPVDFNYLPGDTLHIYVVPVVEGITLRVPESDKRFFSFDTASRILKFQSPKGNSAQHYAFIMQETDTLNVIQFSPAVSLAERKGFSQYKVANILDERNYQAIKVDSTSANKTLRVNGRKIVFENKPGNTLYKFSYRKGHVLTQFKRIEIGADTLILNDRMHFPAAKLTINARVIIINYDGDKAAVDITPVKYEPGAVSVDKYPSGKDGLPADTLMLFYDTLVAKNREKILFAAKGGDGENAPNGKDGVDYPVITAIAKQVVLRKPKDCAKHTMALPNDPRSNSVISVDYYYKYTIPHEPCDCHGDKGGGKSGPAADYETAPDYFRDCNYPYKEDRYATIAQFTAGLPKVGGKPGEPGNGGIIISNHDVSAFSSVEGGLPGDRDKVRTSGKITGPAEPYALVYHHGQPNWKRLYYPTLTVLEPLKPVMEKGGIGALVQRSDSTAWANIAYVNHVVDYAEDLFRFGAVEPAAALLTVYNDTYFTNASIPPADSASFRNLSNRVKSAINKIQANLDYYGNRYGFVPGLDLVANTEIYKASIRTYIEAYAACLYLENETVKDKNKQAAAVKQIEKYLEQNINLEKDFSDIENVDIPLIKQRLDTATLYLENVSKSIERLEKAFVKKAKDKIKERERREKNKSFLRTITTIAKVVPVYQPALGLAASTFEAFALKEEGQGLMDQISHVATDYKNITDMSKKYEAFKMTVSDKVLQPSSDVSLPKRIYNNREALMKTLTPYVSSTQKILAGLKNRKVLKQSVEAEVAKLKAKHPLYSKLIDSVKTLAELNGSLMESIVNLENKLVAIDREIGVNSVILDDIKTNLTTVSIPSLEKESVLEGLKKEVLEKLYYNQYLYAKSYEFFLMKQYGGYDYTYKSLREENFAGKDTAQVLAALKSLYSFDAESASFDVSVYMNTNLPSTIKSTKVSFNIQQSDLQLLNAGGTLHFNFFKNPYFWERSITELDKYEDLLIHNISITPKFNQQSVAAAVADEAPFANSKISIRHNGISKRYHGTEVYDFFHISKDGRPFYEWVFDNDLLSGSLIPNEDGETYLRLISILSQKPVAQDKVKKIVSFDSDFTITKTDQIYNDKEVRLESLRIELDLYLVPREYQKSIIVYANTLDRIPVPFRVECENETFEEVGMLYKSFKPEKTVTLHAPLLWQNKRFKHWRYNTEVFTSNNINVKTDKNLKIFRAVYE